MEQIAKIAPLLWEIICNNKKRAINITNKENDIIVNILSGKRWKRFINTDVNILMSEIRTEFQLS